MGVTSSEDCRLTRDIGGLETVLVSLEKRMLDILRVALGGAAEREFVVVRSGDEEGSLALEDEGCDGSDSIVLRNDT